MLNNRIKWIMVLLVLFHITLACSKKEDTKTEGAKQETPKQETPAEQKSAMTGQSQEEAQTKTAGQEKESKTMAAGSPGTAEQSGTGATTSVGQGEEIYKQTCSSCHATGVAGAPKTGDAQAWSSRIAKGEEQMVQNAINGIGAKPPKGGNPSLSEEEIRAAVNYRIEQSR
jgi:cytochrome c5